MVPTHSWEVDVRATDAETNFMHLEPNSAAAVPVRHITRCLGHVDVGDTLVEHTLVGLESNSATSSNPGGRRRSGTLGVVASEVTAVHVGDLHWSERHEIVSPRPF